MDFTFVVFQQLLAAIEARADFTFKFLPSQLGDVNYDVSLNLALHKESLATIITRELWQNISVRMRPFHVTFQ